VKHELVSVTVRFHASICLLVALTVSPRSIIAQLRGEVVEPSGAPVEGALVELWSGTARLAGQITASEGAFSFPVHVVAPATSVLVRGVGYAPTRMRLGHAENIRITLLPIATPIRPLTVTGGTVCPRREDPTARGLWEALRDRYATVGPSKAYWSEMKVQAGRMAAARLGEIDTLRLEPGLIGGSRRYYEIWHRRIADSGYARSYSGLRIPRYDLWEYAALESILARHFVDSLFGALHTLSLEPERQGSIVFCPRDRTRPSVEGYLEVDADTLLTAATWRFRTPPPIEEAGGEVFFARPALPDPPTPLFPTAGRFWRKLVVDYYQEWREYRKWYTCHDKPNARLCQ